MMAREAGIPARMAIGFLPGTADRGTYTVRASDAHAWPELYFEGIGWLRFEPTPSGTQSTVAPPYSLAPTTPGNDPTWRPAPRPAASTADREPPGRGATTPAPPTPTETTGGDSGFGELARAADPHHRAVGPARARSSACSGRWPSRSRRAAGSAAGCGTPRTSRPASRSSGRR